MRKDILTITAALALTGQMSVSMAQNQTETAWKIQDYVESAAKSPELRTAMTGVLAVTMSGDTLACLNPEKMMIPASDLKLVTTGLAVHSLGSDYRWETRIGHDGEIVDGVLKGNLYIIGGGDPTTGSKDSIAVPVTQTFEEWTGIVRDAGIRRIDGYIIGDGRHFSGMAEHESWQYNDLGTYYGSGASGLSFFENAQHFRVSPGKRPGEPLQIYPEYPDTPWMQYEYECTTGKPGTGNSLYFYPSFLTPEGIMRGSFAIDRKPKTEKASNKFPAYTCAFHFMQYLESQGIRADLGAADTGTLFGPTAVMLEEQDSLRILGSTLSPELKRVIFETNHDSNNFYAETLFKTLGKEYCGKGCYDSTYVAVTRLLDEIQVGNGGLRMVDGCGLSRQNYASPDFMCRFLKGMAAQPCFPDYVESLPYPGGSGTLEWIMKDCPEKTRKRIRMKSGSMNGVRCYSGYILPENSKGHEKEMIIFSIMVNNSVAKTAEIQPFFDTLIGLFAENR